MQQKYEYINLMWKLQKIRNNDIKLELFCWIYGGLRLFDLSLNGFVVLKQFPAKQLDYH